MSFIQILEPRATGRYRGQEVELDDKEKSILEDFFNLVNFSPAYKNYPLVSLPHIVSKNIGCPAAGNRFLYIDTRGTIHPCPFCHENSGNAVGDLDRKILNPQVNSKCHKYSTFQV